MLQSRQDVQSGDLGKQVLLQENRRDCPMIYQKAEHYKRGIFQGKALKKNKYFCKARSEEIVGVKTLGKHVFLNRGIFSIAQEIRFWNPWENKHSFKTRLHENRGR